MIPNDGGQSISMWSYFSSSPFTISLKRNSLPGVVYMITSVAARSREAGSMSTFSSHFCGFNSGGASCIQSCSALSSRTSRGRLAISSPNAAIVVFACGSASIMQTLFLCIRAIPAARFSSEVVFATPPLWFTHAVVIVFIRLHLLDYYAVKIAIFGEVTKLFVIFYF